MDKKYVEIDEVRKCIDAVQSYRESLQVGAMDLDADGVVIKISQRIENLPAADVVEVVRCKNCEHKVDFKGRVMCSRKAGRIGLEWYGLTATSNEHFCSYGQKKEGAEE